MPGYYAVKSFSIHSSELEILAELREIALRENKSVSQAIVDAIKEYVPSHKIPNPNARLDRTLETGLPHKAKTVCCVPECKRTATVHLYLASKRGKTETFPVCRLHRGWRNEVFKELKGSKEL